MGKGSRNADLNSFLAKSEEKESDGLVEKLTDIASQFNKKYGSDAIAPASMFKRPEVLSTGIPELDHKVLVIGGVPRGRIIELAGETSAGKTTLLLNICREAIDRKQTVAIAENEGSLTYEYGESIGLPRDKYLILPGKGLSGQEYFERILELIEMGIDIVGIDSMQGLKNIEAITAGLVDANMRTKLSMAQLTAGFAAQLQGGWISKLNPGSKSKPNIFKMIDSPSTLIVINHLITRSDGSRVKESTGGEVIKYLYTIRLFMERLSLGKKSEIQVDENGDPIYTRVKLTTNKNKLAPPYRSTVLFLDNRIGRFVSDDKALVEIAELREMIIVGGSWITFEDWVVKELGLKGELKFQGAKKFAKFCNDNPNVMKRIVASEE